MCDVLFAAMRGPETVPSVETSRFMHRNSSKKIYGICWAVATASTTSFGNANSGLQIENNIGPITAEFHLPPGVFCRAQSQQHTLRTPLPQRTSRNTTKPVFHRAFSKRCPTSSTVAISSLRLINGVLNRPVVWHLSASVV